MKANSVSKIDELKNLPENRKCFDCHEKVKIVHFSYKFRVLLTL